MLKTTGKVMFRDYFLLDDIPLDTLLFKSPQLYFSFIPVTYFLFISNIRFILLSLALRFYIMMQTFHKMRSIIDFDCQQFIS